jgi:pyruvate dehydrogenase E1 component alpha subunit
MSVELRRRAALENPMARLERMLEIRATEDVIRQLFAEGLVAGSTHTCQGQEAISVALGTVLRPTDSVCCTYRGHGHAMALGMQPAAVIGEILGRQLGCVGGVGGSMHLCDRSIGLMPTMAIIGAGIPIAAGAAWAAQQRGRDDVAVAVFGDGTVNIGAFHEGLNLAAVWKLPAVFVIENNLYGEYSRFDTTTPLSDLSDRAGAYGIPGIVVDGQDVDAAIEAVSDAVARARSGAGPTLLEMKTYRYAGHSRSDQAKYRPEGELDLWLARDPINILAERLIEGGFLERASLDEMRRRAVNDVLTAVEQAKASDSPLAEAASLHVYERAAAGFDGSSR